MSAIALGPWDLVAAASLVALDAVVSVFLRLRLHRQILSAAARLVIQLVAVGYLLRYVFRLHHPAATLGVVVLMSLIAAREIASRPERRFVGRAGYVISGTGVLLATMVTIVFALGTAIRPQPWYDARYAVPLAGIVLGSVLNAGSITLDDLLGGVARQRSAIEAQLALGIPFRVATAPVMREAVRRGLVPIINQMSAAGVVTLPGIMTGQIIAGMDPIEAVKYQILLMFLLAGASGIASLSIARLALRSLTDDRERLRLDRLRA